MNPELIEKEKKYHKLNEELEVRTKELMKEVEKVCEKLNVGCAEKIKTEIEDEKNYEKLCSENRDKSKYIQDDNINKKELCTFRSETLNKVINMNPHKENKSLAELSTNTTNKNNYESNSVFFLQAKAKILQNELHEMKALYLERVKEHTNLQIQHRKLEKEINDVKKLHMKTKELKSICEKKVSKVTHKLKEYETENKSLKNEIESLKMTINHLKIKDAHQLKQLLEEVDRLNEKLMKAHEHEKCILKSHLNKKELHKKYEDKPKSDTEVLLKKQLQLVANLKKQKRLVETMKPLKLGEEKFLKVFSSDS